MELSQNYVVLKMSDMKKYLNDDEISNVRTAITKITSGRMKQKQEPLHTLVIESHWPEHDDVKAALTERIELEALEAEEAENE